MKIIFVAFSENSLGRRILNGLIDQGDTPTMVLMASDSAFEKFRKNGIKRYIKLHGYLNLLWRIYYRLTQRKDLKNDSLAGDVNLKVSIRDKCKMANIPLGFFDNINNDDFVNILKGHNPDLIVLGGAPLIKEKVINLPRIGVLNSHPGILPQAKGMDVIAHSIINDIPLGVTVFKVDAGIDSGPILFIRNLTQSTEGKKLHEIEAMVEELASKSMLEAVRIVKSGNYHFEPQSSEGTIFRALNYLTYKKVLKRLKNGYNS
jgi:folate-dependent phosphoribosylglycinamide formyltransferase PurN